MGLHERRERTPKANCVEAGAPEIELHAQREKTPKANCVEAEGQEMELHEQREQTPKATSVEAEVEVVHAAAVATTVKSRCTVDESGERARELVDGVAVKVDGAHRVVESGRVDGAAVIGPVTVRRGHLVSRIAHGGEEKVPALAGRGLPGRAQPGRGSAGGGRRLPEHGLPRKA